MKNTNETAAHADEETRICSQRGGAKLPPLNPAKSIADWEAWGAKPQKKAKRTEADAQRENISNPVVQYLFDASEALS